MRSLDMLLNEAAWFCGLDALQQKRVREEILVRDFDAHAIVCKKNETSSYWIGVVDGLIKISNVSIDGKSVSFAGVTAGGWVGEGSVMKKEPRKYDVIALRKSRLALMPVRTFEWLLDCSIAFNRFLLNQLNERLGQFIAALEHERLLGPNAKLARCIAQLFNPILYPGQSNRVLISQSELGYLTGLSRQRTNQALQVLQDAGMIRVDYGRIEVLDLAALQHFDDT